MKFHSQVGQDRFLLEHFFRGRRGGVFVDIGAYDGETLSNTFFFERSMGWTGLCVEPLPGAFARLRATRKAICENVALSDYEGEADFVEADARGGVDQKMFSGLSATLDPRDLGRMAERGITRSHLRVRVARLSSLLEKHGLFDIDYCSIDVEGGELKILSDLDFERFRIKLFTIENNYGDKAIPELMASKGYELYGRLEQDDVYKRADVKPLARTSVICAVWHRDPKRHELLRAHQANLAAQSVPVDPIYVFDGGDTPPSWIEGRVASVREKLTIYQAWNVALSMVETPLVMNLNLDDRLAPDAVALLEHELQRLGGVIAGGEWKVCYSQDETDAVEPCYPASRVPFVSEWPPKAGTVTRLGSGTGERGTLGPATIWRMTAHIGTPRYPWRTADGATLKVAGDLAWWQRLMSDPKIKLVRLPVVIGNYHSHPQDQAEFSAPDEAPLFQDPGISIL